MDILVRNILSSFLNREAYGFSSVQAQFPDKISEKIRKWGMENIPEEEIAIKPYDNSSGREEDIHVTVKYGLHTNRFEKVRNLFVNERPIEVSLGKISIFDTSDEHDVVKLELTSSALHRLNKLISKTFECTDTFPKYIPHITLAYVNKGCGNKYVGGNDFEGKKVKLNKLIFSGRDNLQSNIILPL